MSDQHLVDLRRRSRRRRGAAGGSAGGCSPWCQCGACAARQDGGVTRLKNAASWESTIRSAYPSRSSSRTVATRRVVGQHVLHAEAVHADGGPGVHQLAQVVEVLAVAAVPDDEPLGADPALDEERQLVAAVARRRVGVGGDRHAGPPVRGRRGLHHPATSGVRPGWSVTTLSIAGPDAGAGDALLDVAEEELDQWVRAADEPARAVGRGSTPAARRPCSSRSRRPGAPGPLGHRGHPGDVAAEARGRSGRRRSGPRASHSRSRPATAVSTHRPRATRDGGGSGPAPGAPRTRARGSASCRGRRPAPVPGRSGPPPPAVTPPRPGWPRRRRAGRR